MDKTLRGTETEQNLLKAFAGEAQARTRYNYYATQARKEGYEVIAKFFDETAHNEYEHGQQFFGFLEGGMLAITGSYPAGLIGTTKENLLMAAEGEYDEWADLYPLYAKVAEEEGFREVSLKFRMIVEVEKDHEARFRKLREVLEAGEMFRKSEKEPWRCRECGYVHESLTAPQMCPICGHTQAFFEIMNDIF